MVLEVMEKMNKRESINIQIKLHVKNDIGTTAAAAKLKFYHPLLLLYIYEGERPK